MTTSDGSTRARLSAALLLAMVVAACSPAAVASPSPSATATPEPTPTATPAPTPTPEPTPSPTPKPTPTPEPTPTPPVDAAADLAIAAPYKLTPLDPALEALFRKQLAASSFVKMDIGGRQITDDGVLTGYIIVVQFAPGAITDASYPTFVTGFKSSSNAKWKTATVSGIKLDIGTTATSTLALYHDGDRVIIVAPMSASDVTPIVRSLASANR